MSNMHRLIWFDKHIRAMSYPNRQDLSVKFEISVRQAQRDIDYLKNSLEAPIRYDAGKRGYYYEDESYILPNVYINDLQRKMLKFLAYRYENYTQTPKVAQLSQLFKRLAEEEDVEDEIPIFDLGSPVVQSYYTIYNAICSRNRLELAYKDPYKGDITLIIDPYKLFYKYNTDHLAGYDNAGEDFTVLRLDRILAIKVLAESFSFMEGFRAEKYSGFVMREPYVARVRFTMEQNFRENRGVKIRYLGDLIYEIHFFDIEDTINMLICSSFDRVLSPKWLNQKIKARCEEIIKRLGEV